MNHSSTSMVDWSHQTRACQAVGSTLSGLINHSGHDATVRSRSPLVCGDVVLDRDMLAIMRILMLTQWFDPEPTFKGLLFAQELQRQGHQVQVLTGFPNYPGGKLYDGYRVRLFQRETIDGIRVLRVLLYPSHDGSGIRRLLNYLSFAVSATLGGLFLKRPDVAYVYHPPATIGLPAFALKIVKGVPFVYDVQDLWPDTLAATGMIRSGVILRFADRVMSRIYRSATRVVVLSDGFQNALVARRVPLRRIEVIPNWADEKQIAVEPRNDVHAAELGFNEHFTVTFAGNMGRGQALETVLEAAELLRDVPNFRFLLVGEGIEGVRLRDEANLRRLPNVEFMPRRPINEIGEILTLSDALLVHLRDDPLFSITIPSKTQAYLMSGRPILMGVRGDAARMIDDAGAGLTFEPESPTGLAEAVRALMAMTPERRHAMGVAGQRHYNRELSLAVGAEKFARVFEEAKLSKPFVLAAKRLVDVCVSTIVLALLSLPMAGVALLVQFQMGSPILFKQSRPGLDGEPFNMFKFRTMNDIRDGDGDLLPDGERLTRFGRWMRSSSIDELPELWNVLRGDMSLVGPRPLLLRYTKYFTDEESLRLDVKPGVTGWAQINGRNTAAWDERLALDVWYVRNLSICLDFKILLHTSARVFRRQGVVVDPESLMLNLDDERQGQDVQ